MKIPRNLYLGSEPNINVHHDSLGKFDFDLLFALGHNSREKKPHKKNEIFLLFVVHWHLVTKREVFVLDVQNFHLLCMHIFQSYKCF